MPTIRNRLASVRAGGPRQFAELRDKFLISTQEGVKRDVQNKLDRLGFQVDLFNNVDGLVAEPRGDVDGIIQNLRDRSDVNLQQAVDEVRNADGPVVSATSNLVDITSELMNTLSDIDGIQEIRFVDTRADNGPENLRMAPSDMPTISMDRADETEENLSDVNELLGLDEAWEQNRGENAIVAIFDTGFAEGLISEERLVDTWNGEDVDSVYAPAEGHGTMCAGAAAANSDEGVPYNGSAPDAGVILVRTTDSNGQIRSDYISKAWDWIQDLDVDRPIVMNHSYGTPICSGRPRRRFCSGPTIDVIETALSNPEFTAVYAAGNEAGTCGHRLSGVTSAITGENSLPGVIAIGALRYDMNDAQRYSSHGRGDCAPISDPKPDITAPLPSKCYYGEEDGYKIKDMSTGVGGSSAGTSHASPTSAGMIALIQSEAMDVHGEPLQTEELKEILKNNADQPRPTQVNALPGPAAPPGWDARFGYGVLNISEALDDVQSAA